MSGAEAGDVIQVGNRQYQLHSFLGKGGFSQVFLGVDATTKKRVALKIMTPKKNSEEAKSQLNQSTSEIKAMKQLNHPNVVRLLGYDLKCKVKGELSIVMVQQLCPKGELFDYLMYTKNFPAKWAMALFHQLCSGLKHMHDNNIAHRDLKPENLLFDNNYTLKIADFGFSHQYQKKNESNPHRMRTELGTRGYMAPEIISPSGKYTNKADVFASGVILFIMLAGFPPFQTAEKADWWFDKLIKGKHALFWKAHERTATFEAGAKKLLIAMMSPAEKGRPDVDQILNDKYVLEYANYQKNELQNELKRRKSTVDKQKTEDVPSRDTLLEVLESIENYNELRPDKDQFLSLNQFLKSEFHSALENSGTPEEVMQAMVNAVEDWQEREDLRQLVMHKLSRKDAMHAREILVKRDTHSEEWASLKNVFEEKTIDHFAAKLKETPVGAIDDWDMVLKLSKYEEDLTKLPQYPTGYCNAWKTPIGFGVLVYCVHTFAKARCQVEVDKKNHVIKLIMRIKKKVTLPSEESDEWKTGTIPVKVVLELKLFKGDQNHNVLTIQNTTHFAMEEARAIIGEITSNRQYHLRYFLEQFDHEKEAETVHSSAYYEDSDIGFLPEVESENAWVLGL